MNKFCAVLLSSIFCIVSLGAAPLSSAADDLQMSPEKNEPDALKCLRVSWRFSLCGNTNFKNKAMGGFGVHFSTVDPNGRLRHMGPKHEIRDSSNACDALMNEEAAPAETRKKAVKVCKEMFDEHQAQLLKTR